jgi:hypothetical protein
MGSVITDLQTLDHHLLPTLPNELLQNSSDGWVGESLKTYSTAMSIKSFLTKPSKCEYPKVVFGTLVVAIVLTFLAIWNIYTTSPQQRQNTYGSLSASILLLLNVIAFEIRFNPIVTVVLRIFTMLWMLLVFVLLFIQFNNLSTH